MNLPEIKTYLQGKKTYVLIAIGLAYLVGVWLGFYELDEKILGLFGLGFLASFRSALGKISFLVIAAVLPLMILVGCAGGPQGTVSAGYDQDGTASVGVGLDVSTNVNIGLDGQYSVPTGDWSATITVTFKDEPSQGALQWANTIGLSPQRAASGTVYVLDYNPANRAHQQFLQFALHDGATISSGGR